MSNTNEQNVDRDWSFDINLSGLVAPTGRGSQLPEGYYKAVVDDMYVNPDKADRIIIKLIVADGPFKGTIRTTGLNKPKSAEDKVRYYWRGLAESAGYTPAQLDNGEISLSPRNFMKKTTLTFTSCPRTPMRATRRTTRFTFWRPKSGPTRAVSLRPAAPWRWSRAVRDR
jgi:hypothetical protein